MSWIVVELKSNPESVTNPRRRVVRTIRILGWTCVWFGLFLLGFVAHQLFFTTWLAQQNNNERSSEAVSWFASAEIGTVEYVPGSDGPGSDEPGSGAVGDPVPLLVEAPPPEGEAFAIIRIPTIERLSEGWAVVEGVTRADLRNGAGHMPSTALPGQPGNAVISGHRTTYGAPFHELDELRPGDRIEVETAIGIHAYAVRETVIVRPTEFWVVQDRPGAWLTLTTCHPKFSSRQRMIVFAELVDGPNAEALGVS
ncbi:MAG TPA: class E sortase [Acidimicrobiia bacterium]|nr:class E sortase [Acidimicrobiia bacterium]